MMTEETADASASIEDNEWASAMLGTRAAASSSRLRRRLIAFIVARYGPTREWSVEIAARLIGIDERTFARWRSDRAQLERALVRRDDGFLLRLACLLAPAPWTPTPMVPNAMRLRRDGSRLSLEMRATHDAGTTLARWVDAAWPTLTVERSGVRVVVTGPPNEVRTLRESVMRIERWRTLTPRVEDVDAWDAGGAA